MALLRHPLIAPSALMDPRENCIDLSPSERVPPSRPSLSSLSFLFRLRDCRLPAGFVLTRLFFGGIPPSVF